MGNIGPFICALRKEQHMTQKELAERLDGARSAPPPDRQADAGPVPDGAGQPDSRARSWRQVKKAALPLF